MKFGFEGTTYFEHPRLIALGGDHSVALSALRALNKVYGQPVSVLHFDAHLDTWDPVKYPSTWFDGPEQQSDFTHGTMFWIAANEGLIAPNTSVHAGLRTRLSGDDFGDYDDDDRQGWLRIETDDVDVIGTKGITDLIMRKIGTERPVYVSVDIDVIDPGMAPGTGTPEVGGWTTRELIKILRGLEDLNVVGADVVEVSPAYDDRGEGTALAGAQIVYEILTSVVKRGLKEMGTYKEIVKPGRDEIIENGVDAESKEAMSGSGVADEARQALLDAKAAVKGAKEAIDMFKRGVDANSNKDEL